MKITKKIVDVAILVIFAVILTAVCKCNVPISENKHNIPASDINILLDMRDGLSDADILTYYKNDIEDVEAITNGNITIYYYDVDLNEDNQIDKIVHIRSSLHAGSHGDMLNILVKEANSYRVALTGTYRLFLQQEQEPLGKINIMENVSEGFHDIRMISDGAEIILRYNGEGYQHVEKSDSLVEQYYGKWKVVAYLPLNVSTVQQTTWQKEHYFGRTVEITEDGYTKSIFYWPQELNEHTFFYDYCEVTDLDREDKWITRNAEELRWLEGDYLKNKTIRMLIFYKEGETYPETYCAVSDDNKYIIESWLSGDYLLERFDTQEINVAIEDIYGEWTITRLDSYDNAYEGRKEDTEWVPEYYTSHLRFCEFYAPEWFGKKVVITDDFVDVASEISGNITEIEAEVINKEKFERLQGIHDELSLTNEEIIVYKIRYGEEDDVLRIVPFNKNKMAIHIEFGWFIMEKGIEEPVAALLNQSLFYDVSLRDESSEINELAGAFGESVRGEFEVVLEEKGVFPEGLVTWIEEALYGSLDYKTEYWLWDWERSADAPYYKMLSELGADTFQMDLEDIYEQFPEMQSADVTFEDEYDAFQYLKGELCYNIFHIPLEGQKDRYIALVDSGGSAGGVEIQVCEWDGKHLVTIYDASVCNPLCSRIIRYEDDYYYMFLHSNYGLKVEDGVQIFKLGEEKFEGNLMIKYVAEEFVWENIYSAETAYSEDINSYLESMKETIISGEWLEGGQDKDIIGVMRGDEWATYEIPLAEEHHPCYGVDFANIGTYVYLEKHNHWPSNTTSSWHLYADFYLWDESTDCITELEKLAVNVNQSIDAKIVQLWFKKIEDKVFTFRISHVSSFNYVLDVLLIEGDEVTHMQRNLISPKRGFVLYEGSDIFGVG